MKKFFESEPFIKSGTVLNGCRVGAVASLAIGPLALRHYGGVKAMPIGVRVLIGVVTTALVYVCYKLFNYQLSDFYSRYHAIQRDPIQSDEKTAVDLTTTIQKVCNEEKLTMLKGRVSTRKGRLDWIVQKEEEEWKVEVRAQPQDELKGHEFLLMDFLVPPFVFRDFSFALEFYKTLEARIDNTVRFRDAIDTIAQSLEGKDGGCNVKGSIRDMSNPPLHINFLLLAERVDCSDKAFLLDLFLYHHETQSIIVDKKYLAPDEAKGWFEKQIRDFFNACKDKASS